MNETQVNSIFDKYFFKNIVDILPSAIIIIKKSGELCLSNTLANKLLQTCSNTYLDECQHKCSNHQNCIKKLHKIGNQPFQCDDLRAFLLSCSSLYVDT